ncbi:MAG: bifunctional (p)ppGpp synthetase/guanosine-3',5'-bis(diphosphate) 3'-pyrophosphohydrolase [Candidatus Liptonbacteria bacterium]|nr:bifunctional (p)ppGpp synthetase/guanosine-3',5'-bis(diphosphate) 3'-pyrophosphohydrolase [Candidatus Liptonbacteria bacterium]
MTIAEFVKIKPNSVTGRAFAFAEKAHAGQKRENGEPYFKHVLATAEILNEWHLDEDTIAAGLLHDIVEDTGVPIAQIKEQFGEEVAFLVDGVTKLGRIKYRGVESKVENMRKMILALSHDLRVVFIKLADRLHNMKTLAALPPVKQKRIALETDEIYAPLAYRLGMQNLSGELHDLAFPYLYHKEDKWLEKIAVELYENRYRYLEHIKPALEETLHQHKLKPIQIDFRAKRRSSLYHKLLRHNMDMEKIYDIVAMRIIVETIPECYAVLGIIHEKWPPLPGRIKDYIAMPKPNNYRSLHTTVIGPEGKMVEFQIRTKSMHEENEHGVAAHWIYEQSKKGVAAGGAAKKMAEELRWVQQLKNWQEKFRSKDYEPDEFMQAMKIDFFKDRIFAITPKGDVIDLPVGSTPVDFAYQIHSEVGDSCVGAKVNNTLVPLDHELHSGELVEIITQKNKKPAEDWLKFVKTALARDHIKNALRNRGDFARRANLPTKTELKITVEDRVGLIKDISAAIAQSHIKILSFHAPHQPGKFLINKVEVDTTDKKTLQKLIVKLKKVKGVREVSYKLV